jgi:hypothetical protein
MVETLAAKKAGTQNAPPRTLQTSRVQCPQIRPSSRRACVEPLVRGVVLISFFVIIFRLMTRVGFEMMQIGIEMKFGGGRIQRPIYPGDPEKGERSSLSG